MADPDFIQKYQAHRAHMAAVPGALARIEEQREFSREARQIADEGAVHPDVGAGVRGEGERRMIAARCIFIDPFAPLLREAAPIWRHVRRWRHLPRIAHLQWLERELNASDMRLAEVIAERLWLERAP